MPRCSIFCTDCVVSKLGLQASSNDVFPDNVLPDNVLPNGSTLPQLHSLWGGWGLT